jgi:LuxR family quorum sensing-dependent transcriptional regulator
MAQRGRDEAFAFIDGLDRTSSAGQVLDCMGRALSRHGIEYFCLNGFPRTNQCFEEVMLAVRVPTAWLALYLEKKFAHADPSIRHCKRTVAPFEWKDAPYDAAREPHAAEVIQRAIDFGVSKGLLVPIPSPAGCVGDVWMGGDRPDFSAPVKPMLHLMALYAFDRVRLLHGGQIEPRPSITGREREVLAWAAVGKSAWEIGEILGISKRTVDEHTQTACRKLGATNRTQGVAIAIRERIITP